MQTISNTAATAPVLAFEQGHATFLFDGKIHQVKSVGLVTGVGWTFRTSTGIVAPAHMFEAVEGGWLTYKPPVLGKSVGGYAPGWRRKEWHAEEGGGYWEYHGKSFLAEVVW